MEHHHSVSQSFGPAAHDYLTSPVHAQGDDLKMLGELVAAGESARVLDLGCGAGHASFAVAPFAREVVACDLTEEMLSVAQAEAARRRLTNLRTVHASAERLPFPDASFEWVVSRYSAHHWRNLPQALREIHRVLTPNGRVCFIDVAGGAEPLYDTWLQSIELLRDPSHVRDYTETEWLTCLRQAGFEARIAQRWRLPIAFDAWVARMHTPPERVAAIRSLWQAAPAEARNAWSLQPDCSFQLDALMLLAEKQQGEK